VTARRDLHEQNRRSWNAGTAAYNSHKGDQAAFLRGGGCTLFPEELELLGDVAGLDLLHLQCNSGQDTLSLAALGAPSATRRSASHGPYPRTAASRASSSAPTSTTGWPTPNRSASTASSPPTARWCGCRT